jgi:hypothetical protein
MKVNCQKSAVFPAGFHDLLYFPLATIHFTALVFNTGSFTGIHNKA